MDENKPRVALVDDDESIRIRWQKKNPDVELITYATPAAFWSAMEDDPDLLGSFDCVVTEIHFADDDDDQEEPGGELMARRIEDLGGPPVILNTGMPDDALPICFYGRAKSKTDQWQDIVPILAAA